MARISKAVAETGLNKVFTAMEQAAQNKRLSRDEKKGLVADLRKQGEGTQAQLVHNVFTIVDSIESNKGAVVTTKDFEWARTYVLDRLVAAYDTNNNGLSQAEIAQMSKTAKGLIELGQYVEKVENSGKGGRIAHDVPVKGMNHTAALLKGAMGGDGVLSRVDLSALVSDLESNGRGTEALAVARFGAFTDHRDHKPGARVTASDIDRAVTYSTESLLKNKDTNRNGYSANEVKNLSTSAKAFLLVGQMLEAGIIKS